MRWVTTTPTNPDGLNASQLRLIADSLERLASVPADIEAISVHGMIIHVKKHTSQREGDWYTVTGIECGD